MLSQFLRDSDLYKNYPNSQEQSLSQSLFSSLTINSNEDECKDISSTETTNYEASQMVLTQCPIKVTQKQPKPVIPKSSTEETSDFEVEFINNNSMILTQCQKKDKSGLSFLGGIIDKEVEKLIVQENAQDVTVTTSTVFSRDVAIQCSIINATTKMNNASVQTESIRHSNKRKGKVSLRLGLSKNYRRITK